MLYRVPEKKDRSPWSNMNFPLTGKNDVADFMKVFPHRYAFKDPTISGIRKNNRNTSSNSNKTVSISKVDEKELQRQRERQEKINMLNAEKGRAIQLMNQNYDLQKKEAKTNNENNLKNIYVAYMQGIKNIPQQTALWGAGGEIESLKNQRRINYEDNRVKENANYNGVLNKMQQQYNNDLLELERKYMQLLMGI